MIVTFKELPTGSLFTLEETSTFPLVFKKLNEKHYLSADRCKIYPWSLHEDEVYPISKDDDQYKLYEKNLNREKAALGGGIAEK